MQLGVRDAAMYLITGIDMMIKMMIEWGGDWSSSVWLFGNPYCFGLSVRLSFFLSLSVHARTRTYTHTHMVIWLYFHVLLEL